MLIKSVDQWIRLTKSHELNFHQKFCGESTTVFKSIDLQEKAFM